MDDLDNKSEEELRSLALKKAKGINIKPLPNEVLDSMSEDELRKAAMQKAASDKDPNSLEGQDVLSFMRSGKDQSARGRATLPTGPEAKQGFLNQLPAAGSVAGGIAGAAAGNLIAPVAGSLPGEMIGSGLGGSTGEALKYAGEKYWLGKDMSKEDLIKNAALGFGAGVVGAGAGRAVGAVGKSFASSGVNDIAQSAGRPGATAIRNAAGRLGVEPTAGMLTDDYTTRNVEDSLGQSPSIPGAWIRSEQRPIQEAVKASSKEALDDASLRSNYDTGRDIRSGVAGKLESELEPISKSYDEIESHTKNIDLNPKSLTRVANNIRSIDEARFEGFDGHKIANQFADALEQAKSVNDIKILRTKALGILRDENSSFEARQAAGQVVGKLEKIQQNSITRQAVSLAREAPVTSTSKGKFLNKSQKSMADQEATAEGENIGKKLIGDIKTTNKQYRGLMQSIKEFGEGSGLTKGRSAGSAIEDIKNANPQDMAKALFDPKNIEYTNKVKAKFPEEYELARQQALSEIQQKTQTPSGDVDPKKLLKYLNDNKMPVEVQTMLFGEEGVKKLKDADTLVKATPGKVGASDTPRGESFKWHELLNPATNIGDTVRYGLLKGKPKLPALGAKVKGLVKPAQYLGTGLVHRGMIEND